MIEEIWKDIAGHEGRYQVSDQGRVRSLDREATHASGSVYLKKGRVLTVHVGAKGYGQVTLTGEGRWKTHMVHRLVAEAFLPKKEKGQVVRHLDGDKKKNAARNLCYGTPQQNSDDQIRHGTTRKGEAHPLSKLTEKDVLEIRAATKTYQQLADHYGVSKQLIGAIRCRKLWKHI